jgi:hypothetical protein
MNLFRFFRRSKPGTHRIKYIVKGDAKDFNVTYKCGFDYEVTQEPSVHKGWKHKFVGNQDDYFYISAQSNHPNSEVEVMIYEDGKLVEKVAKSGDYPIVLLSGLVHHFQRPQ